MRAAKAVPLSTAASQLGNGWSENNNTLAKNYTFEDFHQASNFLQRYTEYCQRVNLVPEWSNVYNRVTVRLHNAEVDGVTAKELNAGHYLDMVEKNSDLNVDVEEVLSFEHIVEVSRIDVRRTVNDQTSPTSLYKVEEHHAHRTEAPMLLN